MANIIVNADDYGMSSEINVAILQAAKDDVIHSVSVDVCNGITRSEAEKILMAKISIGLHLNLTEGRPIGNDGAISELLTPEGCLKPASIGLASNIELESLVVEFRHQLNRFRFLFDLSPTHIDSHQHFTYLQPSAFEAMLKVAKAEGIPIRCPKPFVHEGSLRIFCERVESRYGIRLPIVPEERARVLADLFNRYIPKLRSQELYLDFDPSVLKRRHQETTFAEMIIHPNLDMKGRNGF